jgi:hypothetical protein
MMCSAFDFLLLGLQGMPALCIGCFGTQSFPGAAATVYFEYIIIEESCEFLHNYPHIK